MRLTHPARSLQSGKFAQEKFSEAKEAGAFSYFKEFGKVRAGSAARVEIGS